MTLQESMLSQELTNADLTKVAALQQKRTLAFVNHFVLTNVQFLNNFMRRCEQKLMHFERKIEKVNAAMILLESRLSSIPELNSPTESSTAPISETKPSEENNNVTPSTQDSQDPTPETKDSTHEESIETTEAKPQVRPEYDRFVKMVQVGVPLQAVKLKLSLEGLDPNVLDEILNSK